MKLRSIRSFAIVFAAFAVAACESGGPTGPTPELRQFNTGDGAAREVTVCKIGPAGTFGTFSISGSPAGVGSYTQGSTFTLETTTALDPSKCKTVWRGVAPTDPTVTLTITETNAIPTEVFVDASLAFTVVSNVVTLTVNFDNGAFVRFTNGDQPPPPPPPPGGGQGCTPGYWKQSQHFGSWTAPYTPSTQFSAVFENAFPGMTLLQVLAQGGGGLKALGRHTVAALLNSASAGVDYDVSTAGVISAFNAVFPGGDYEGQKNIFADFNEQGCPLGRAE